MNPPETLYDMERALREEGHIVCGVDEAGRGPLAGPVVAAAVILPESCDLPGLNDSKQLSEKRRERLYDLITAQAMSFAVVMRPPERIDEINILRATMEAMDEAIRTLSPAPTLALIDGAITAGIHAPARAVVRGDASCACIAAASVLAKVTRDRYMRDIAQVYPMYHFERHKGYPTQAHYAALDEYGPCPIHRQSFLRKYYASRE